MTGKAKQAKSKGKLQKQAILVWTKSLGCPKNFADSESLLGALKASFKAIFELELEAVEEVSEADLILLNTCSFIQSAVRESIQNIVEIISDLSDLNSKPLFAVAGCLLSRYAVSDLVKDLPEVDLWLTPKNQLHWAELILDALHKRQNHALKIERAELVTKLNSANHERLLATAPYAWLKIADGCNRQCNFCTIPQIRGPLRSKDLASIYHEAKNLIAQGAKEINLVAQDLTTWGQDFKPHGNLLQVLEKLLSLDDLVWLRLLYLYPTGINKELLNFIKDADSKLLPYFDIPLQHAHPEILKAMGRPFVKNNLQLLENIREILPEAVLRTTLIVGYPGETEQHFAYLCKFVEQVQFQHLGVFSYEAEEGTVAATLANQVADSLKKQRREELMLIQAEISRELLSQYHGQTLQILVEKESPEWPGLYQGRVWFQMPENDGSTWLSGANFKIGDLVEAEIVDSTEHDLSALI